MFFSLNKNKIRKNKTPVNRKFFSQKKRDSLKEVSKAKILARIVFYFIIFFNIQTSSALKRGLKGGFTKRTVSLQFYLIS